jgi:hypothetical protein
LQAATTDPTAMSDDSAATLAVSDDLKVAAVAAACTVGLTLVLRFVLARDAPYVVRLLPLAPYFVALFTRRLDLGGFDTVRNWSALTLAVTLGTILYYAV